MLDDVLSLNDRSDIRHIGLSAHAPTNQVGILSGTHFTGIHP